MNRDIDINMELDIVKLYCKRRKEVEGEKNYEIIESIIMRL